MLYLVRRSSIAPKIINRINEVPYYVALGENLVVPCVAYGDIHTSVTWRKDQKSINQSIQHYKIFDINNHSHISPSLDNYKKERVRSRVLQLDVCDNEVLTRSTLDISVADWTDNGLSYSCVSRSDDNNNITEEIPINIVVG